MKYAVIVGTRPEIIKMAILIKKLKELSTAHLFIHSGQHYDYYMDGSMLNTFDLPTPDFNFKVGSGSHSFVTSEIMKKTEDLILKEGITAVIVHGDTNTTLGACLAAAKLNIPVIHVESGLRSFDKAMPEEINRIIVDHLSTILFVPTKEAQNNLKKEGIVNRVYMVGQTLVDSIQEVSNKINTDNILKKYGIKPKEYFFVTCHRQENTNNKSRLTSIVNNLKEISENNQNKIVFSLHPGTKEKLQEFNLYSLLTDSKIIILDPPVNFARSIHLQKEAKVVLTDSGGLQEEACILKTPCLTLRDSTERPETIRCGANRLVNVEKENFLKILDSYNVLQANWSSPYDIEKPSEKIIDILTKFLN
ncbi:MULTISPECIES: non-hydrolyzing UDP-N-acetylglucosamine 2-epimerase [unclassified Priestia]|uniref:non-hydrolyzing UDP-N-acetylglucosamine 2-epimerase n=1 Tax=unclassified Priestia TaxID=2800374 RepID=UPI00366D39BC